MYLVILNDYKNKNQKLLHQTSDFHFARDFAKAFAEDYCFENQGKTKDPHKYPTYGHYIRTSNKCFAKYSVFYKEKSGYLLSGAMNKILSVFVIKIQIDHPARDKSKFVYNELFENVLTELLLITDVVDPIEPNNKSLSS